MQTFDSSCDDSLNKNLEQTVEFQFHDAYFQFHDAYFQFHDAYFQFHDVYVTSLQLPRLNTSRPRQNGRHFADDTFKCMFLNENK